MRRHTLSRAAPNVELLNSIRAIYESSFPEDERRDFDDVIRIATTNSAFYADIYTQNGETLGFILYWRFSFFVFAEHFAIREDVRGSGYGKTIFKDFLSRSALSVVLEVEMPNDETSVRRIRFYENLGMRLCKISYVQPPYNSNKKPISLFLMSYREIELEKRFDEVKTILYSDVYAIA